MTKRRQFSPEQRAAILRRHFGDKIPVSDLCEEYGLQPSVFYRWQQQMLENMAAALTDGRANRKDHREQKIAQLEKRLAAKEKVITRKESVIAEIAEAYVTLKKSDGPAT